MPNVRMNVGQSTIAKPEKKNEVFIVVCACVYIY